MELRLLGAVSAHVGGDVVALGPRQQRLVLGLLAWEVNRPVAVERLVDLVWPEGPPRSAPHAVKVAVSNLRAILADDGDMTIATESAGYVLRADPMRIDANRFLDGVARARLAPNDVAKLGLLDRALELWRGPALAEAAQETRERLCGGLEETRLVAIEDRVDARLRLGQHNEVLGELTTLVEDHPTRERLVGQLMLALHRAGQSTKALELARKTRARLADELGIDPGAELQRLEVAVLRNDPTLDPLPPREPEEALPAHRTRLIGRDRDVADVVERVGKTRLVTLTGPGGVGKTRLALAAARELETSFADGVTVVPLAPVRDPSLVLPTIATSLAIKDLTGVSLRTTVQTYLRDRNPLLLLDNLEHLLDAGPDISWLLDAAPRLTVLATSRAPLRLGGEQLRPVQSLDRHAAVELFTERAQQAGAADDLDAETVDAICERVDRLPLAIELAAARTRLLSPKALLEQLSYSHDLLADGARDLPARHQALSATIAWSYDLLTADEQAMLRATSVFAGGWTAPAAAEVADLDLTTTLRLLGALLDASLIVRDGDHRFTILETVRGFALATGNLDQLRERHAAYVEGFMRQARYGVDGSDQRAWFVRLTAEQDNLRVAMRRLLDRGQFTRCAAILDFHPLWLVGGSFREYQQWAREILADSDQAGVLAHYAYTVTGRDLAEVARLTDDAVARARLGGDPEVLASALCRRAHIGIWSEDYALSHATFTEAETVLRHLDWPSTHGGVRALRANMDFQLGRREQAERELIALEAERRRAGAPWDLGVILFWRAVILTWRAEWAAAEPMIREAVMILEPVGAPLIMVHGLIYLTAIAARRRDPARAARLGGAVAPLADQFSPGMISRSVTRMFTSGLATARDALGAQSYDTLFAEGRAMNWRQTVELALS
ncbi:BTAD domain-containing putative transcriptional regulator [Kutzneria chonburiensis]|uniref:BTAD domain-containing putative transcriptional regulator n=1 Tax=Kutzneria chonburiensis TaxID=1483604 RepID=A0ABV6MYX1_9PSEU|nr:BTAD domain-containing putative transcriptional regulator [Kutzneria chonburiensis]